MLCPDLVWLRDTLHTSDGELPFCGFVKDNTELECKGWRESPGQRGGDPGSVYKIMSSEFNTHYQNIVTNMANDDSVTFQLDTGANGVNTRFIYGKNIYSSDTDCVVPSNYQSHLFYMYNFDEMYQMELEETSRFSRNEFEYSLTLHAVNGSYTICYE